MKFILLVVWLLTLTACTESPRIQPIRISIDLSWSGYACAYVAQEQGFFTKNAVAVQLIPRPGNLETTQLYEKGTVEGVLTVFPDVLMFNAEGLPTQVVYIIDYSTSGDVIIGRPEFNSLSDLTGKIVSFEGVNTFSHLFVQKLLEKSGIPEGTFQTANLPPQQVLTALEMGQIDAGHTWGATATEAQKKGYKVLGKADDIPHLVTDVLAFRKEVIQQRPSDIQAIVKALVEAQNFLMKNPNIALNSMAKFQGISTTQVEENLKGLYWINLQDNVAALRPGGTLFKAGQEIADFYVQHGQLVKVPNLYQIINFQFVQSLKPF